MMWGSHEGMGWWMLFGGLWTLAFWAAIIVLVVWIIKRLVGRDESPNLSERRKEPLDIARERYARGEITNEQFNQIKKDIM